MDRRTMVVWLAAMVTITASLWFLAHASVERATVTADASVARAQEHTKRAEGRHRLVDLLGLVR